MHFKAHIYVLDTKIPGSIDKKAYVCIETVFLILFTILFFLRIPIFAMSVIFVNESQ